MSDHEAQPAVGDLEAFFSNAIKLGWIITVSPYELFSARADGKPDLRVKVQHQYGRVFESSGHSVREALQGVLQSAGDEVARIQSTWKELSDIFDLAPKEHK